MSLGNLLHNLHNQLVMIRRDISCCKDRSHLMLGRSNLVMLRLRENTELPKFNVKVFHKGSNTLFDGAKVMII